MTAASVPADIHPADRHVSRQAAAILAALDCDRIVIRYDPECEEWASFVQAGDVVHAASQGPTPEGAVDAVIEAAEATAYARRLHR